MLAVSEMAKRGIISTFGDGWGQLRLPNGKRIDLIAQDGVYYLEVVLGLGLGVASAAKKEDVKKKEDENEMEADAVRTCNAKEAMKSSNCRKTGNAKCQPEVPTRTAQLVQATKGAVGCAAGFEYWRRQAAFQAATFRRQ